MILWLVIPCYNEREVLPETAKRLKKLMQNMISSGKADSLSRIAFINDGSTDDTLKIISDLCAEDEIFCGINLAKNVGHQSALLAGLHTAVKYADAIISLDADLQDDIGAIEKFVDEYKNGFDIVYGVRVSRKKDTWFKRVTAEGFYKFMKFLGADIVFNHADYRLMSKRAVEALMQFSEVNVFLRGIVPQIGFKSTKVEYERGERFAGTSKYPLKKMISLAMQGITSFSVKPIRISIVLAVAAFFVCLAMIAYCIVQKLSGTAVSGWASLGASIWGLGGLQLLMIGIVGEYIGKIYLETKRRPKFIIESVTYSGKSECNVLYGMKPD